MKHGMPGYKAKKRNSLRSVLSPLLTVLLSIAAIWSVIKIAQSKSEAEIISFFAVPVTELSVLTGTEKDDVPLPQTLEAVLESGETIGVPVSWEDGGLYNKDVTGTYIFTADIGAYIYPDARPVASAAVIETLWPTVVSLHSYGAYVNMPLGGNTLGSGDTAKLVVMEADGDPSNGYYQAYTADINGLRAALWGIYNQNQPSADYIMYFGADVSVNSANNTIFGNTPSATSTTDVTFASLRGRLNTLALTGTQADTITNTPATSAPSASSVHGIIASSSSAKYFGCDLIFRNIRHNLNTGSNDGVYMNGYDLMLGGGSWQLASTVWYFGGSSAGTVTPSGGTATITVYSTGTGTSNFSGGMRSGTLNGNAAINIHNTSGNTINVRGGGLGSSGSLANITGNVTNTITGMSTGGGGLEIFAGGVEYGSVDGRITNTVSGIGRFSSTSDSVSWGTGCSFVGGSRYGSIGTDATRGGPVDTSDLSGLAATTDFVIKNIIDTSSYTNGRSAYFGTNFASGIVKGNIVNIVTAGTDNKGSFSAFSGGPGISAAIGGSWHNSFTVNATTSKVTNVEAGLLAAKNASATKYQLYGNITSVIRAGCVSAGTSFADNDHWLRGAGWGYMEGNAYSEVGTEGVVYRASASSYSYSTTTLDRGHGTNFDLVGGGGDYSSGDNTLCIKGNTTLITRNVLARWTYGGSFGGVHVGDSLRIHYGGVVDTCEGTGYHNYIHVGDGRAEVYGGQVDWFLSGGGWDDTYQDGNVSVEVFDEPGVIINASMGGTYGSSSSHMISGDSTIVVHGGNFSGTARAREHQGFSAGPSNQGYILGNASVTIDLRENQHGFSIESGDSISGGRRLNTGGNIYLGADSNNTITLNILADDSQTDLLNGLNIYGDCGSGSNIGNTRAGRIIINLNAPGASIGNLYATNYSNLSSGVLRRDVQINLVSVGAITGLCAGDGTENITNAIAAASTAVGKNAVINVGPQSGDLNDILCDRETAQTDDGLPHRIRISTNGIKSFTSMNISKRLLIAQSGDIKNGSGATLANHSASYNNFGNVTFHAGEGMEGAGLGIVSATGVFIAGTAYVEGSGQVYLQSTGKADQAIFTDIIFNGVGNDVAFTWLKIGSQAADTNLQTNWFGASTGWRVITLTTRDNAGKITPVNFRGLEESTGRTFIGDSDTRFAYYGYAVAIEGSTYEWEVTEGDGKVSHNIEVAIVPPSPGHTINAYGTVAKDAPSTTGIIAIPRANNVYPTFSFMPELTTEEWVKTVAIYGSDRYIAPPGHCYTVSKGLPKVTGTWTANGTDNAYSFDIDAKFSTLAELAAQDVIITESEAAAIVDADDVIYYTQADGRPFFRNDITAQMLADIQAPLGQGQAWRSHEIAYSTGYLAQTGSEEHLSVHVVVVRDAAEISADRQYALYAENAVIKLSEAQAISKQTDLDDGYTHALAILSDRTTAVPAIDSAAIPALVGLTVADIPTDMTVNYSYAPDEQSTSVQKSVTVHVAPDIVDLTISNIVTGDYADKTKEFTFTVTFWDGNNALFQSGTTISVEGGILPGFGATAPMGGTWTIGGNGEVTFLLKHGQAITIKDAPSYGKVQIVESARENYGQTSFMDDDDAYGIIENAYDTGDRSMSGVDRTFAFTNARNSIVPTGVFLSRPQSWIFPALSLLLILGLGLGIKKFHPSRRRSR
ncbi:MAG: hypothetical protein LBL96_04895 [Clostridiales bacterium]|jgi:hypothetical protein|nr:hypothetical protein [Clostridiales bacterium]